ncbi:uncharacterized protein LOC135839583 isoform X1 [Planococcus citri]|uniref:uncharacterized protein LOC135839583 isoform X1 n=1 Tax=Planococcus citri TaxID=170843 RepID=UPI0031F91337
MSSLISDFSCKCVSFILLLFVIYARTDDVKLLSKRQEYDDFHVCAQNFEIHQDKIIRTEESKRMGAKYLSGKDVSSKDECVKFCCETPNCNVFVLEEKVFNQQSGTCYLFECGTPDNFKCKFTRHHNYSSAVLIINRPQMQLEDEIQYTQHERELTNLRTVEHSTKAKNCNHTTKANTINDNHLNEIKELSKPEDELNTSFRKPSHCSRYQFECRTSGECIAIYNACDGIPQCADHSDEDPELGCPTNAPAAPKKLAENTSNDKQASDENNPNVARGSVPFKATKDKSQQEVNVQELMKNQIPEQGVINRQTFSRQYKLNQWQNRVNQQPYNNANPSEVQNYPANVNVQDPRMVPQHPPSGTGYGREGEMMDTNPWAGKNTDTRVFKQNYGPLHNFNHKQNDINVPYNYGEYGNMGMNQGYDKYNGYPGNNYYPPNGNSWHPRSPSSNYEPERTFPDSKNNEPPRNRVVPEYFYEDANAPVTKTAEPLSQGNVSLKAIYNATALASSGKKPESTSGSSTNITKTTTQSVKQTNPADVTTTIAKKESETAPIKQTVEKSGEQNAHRKLEKQFSAEIVDAREQLLDANIMDGYTEQPNGAFISLTLEPFIKHRRTGNEREEMRQRIVSVEQWEHEEIPKTWKSLKETPTIVPKNPSSSSGRTLALTIRRSNHYTWMSPNESVLFVIVVIISLLVALYCCYCRLNRALKDASL